MDCKFASAASDMWGVGVITYLLGNKNRKKLPDVVFVFGSLIIITKQKYKIQDHAFCCCYLIWTNPSNATERRKAKIGARR